MSGRIDSDATGFSEEPGTQDLTAEGLNVTNQPSTPRQEIGLLKAGIFYADADILIANRICDVLNSNGCKTEKCDFHDAGQPAMGEIDAFITRQNMVLWLATHASLNDKGILEAARYIAQYASITRRDLGIRFVNVKPQEYLHSQLPISLDAYVSLKEDEHFVERIRVTVKSVEEKLQKRGNVAENSTATTSAAADPQANPLRNLPPNSDEGTSEQTMRFTSAGSVQNLASRENTSSASNILQNVIHIHSGNVNMQVGSGNVLSHHQSYKEDKDSDSHGTHGHFQSDNKEDDPDSQGTPV